MAAARSGCGTLLTRYRPWLSGPATSHRIALGRELFGHVLGVIAACKTSHLHGPAGLRHGRVRAGRDRRALDVATAAVAVGLGRGAPPSAPRPDWRRARAPPAGPGTFAALDAGAATGARAAAGSGTVAAFALATCALALSRRSIVYERTGGPSSLPAPGVRVALGGPRNISGTSKTTTRPRSPRRSVVPSDDPERRAFSR